MLRRVALVGGGRSKEAEMAAVEKSTAPTGPAAAPGTGPRPRRRVRRHVVAVVSLSALSTLTATGSLTPEAPLTSAESAAVGPGRGPARPTERTAGRRNRRLGALRPDVRSRQ